MHGVQLAQYRLAVLQLVLSHLVGLCLHSEPMYVWIPMAAFASKPGVYRRIWSNTECMQASAAPSHSAHCMCCVLLLLHVVA